MFTTEMQIEFEFDVEHFCNSGVNDAIKVKDGNGPHLSNTKELNPKIWV